MTRPTPSVQVVISLDVEEDGLGRRHYPRTPPGVTNVEAIDRLAFVTRDFGLPLTLLATYPVIMDHTCAERLARWHEQMGAEIGAHLHPWNTPPHPAELPDSGGGPTPVDAEKMAVLQSAIAQRLGVTPVSFRMGRFAISEQLFDDVQRVGFKRDASVVPFHRTSGKMADYSVPPNPYCLRKANDASDALWEIPLTHLPVWSRAGRWVAAATAGARQSWQIGLQSAFQHLGIAGLHPAWFSLPVMCLAAQLQVARGGRLLHIFMHSSDLVPGCTPAVRTEHAVQQQLHRLTSFLRWLQRHYAVEGKTLGSVSLNSHFTEPNSFC